MEGEPPYWHNKRTGESRWTDPGSVAPVWAKVENGGTPYWFNAATNQSEWTDPQPPAAQDASLAGPPAADDFEALVAATSGDSICEQIGDGVLLRVIVKPSQTEDTVLFVTESCVQIGLRAPKEDGQEEFPALFSSFFASSFLFQSIGDFLLRNQRVPFAGWCNQGLKAFCRRALHVPQRERNAVKIVDGDESLDKIIHIPALSTKDVIKRLHKSQDFEISTEDVEKWIRHTQRLQKGEERRMKRRKWA